MKIEIIGLTGIDAAREAWRRSRDLSVMPLADDIMYVDVPVCEMPTCHLSFDGFTILEREIFATPRNHVMWARTSHVDDPLAFKVPELLQRNSGFFIDNCRTSMIARKAAGASQDEWREHLPVSSLTAWTARHSYRDLVKIAGYFSRLSGRKMKILSPIRYRFNQIAEALFAVLDCFTGSNVATKRAIATMTAVDFLHEGGITLRDHRVIETENFLSIVMEVPIWLRAQIVRHRPLAFVDTFYGDVVAHPGALEKTIADPVRMELSASRAFWKTILSKRSCWIAQDSLRGRRDPWQEIIDQYGFSEDMLPCAKGVCPYDRDAALRLTDADPGAPCPIYLDLAGVDKAPYREEMLVAAESRHESWIKRIRK